jgi:S1-C subfamily serine protease
MLPPVILTAVALAAAPTVASREFTSDAQWAAARACPRITPTDVGQATGGTGVAIGSKGGAAFVLTADHAVTGARELEVCFFSRESYPLPAQRFERASVVLHLPAADLALVRVPVGEWPVPVSKLAAPGRRPKEFPAVALSVGCTGTDAPTCAVESIRAKRLVRRPGNEMAFFWETAAPPQPGRSGGPLIGTDGRVIGLCSAAQDGHGYYVHLDEILAGLKKAGYGGLWED